MLFFDRIEEIVRAKKTCLCIGLDPYFSAETRKQRGDEACIEAALSANRRIIEASHPYAACYKPNLAFYEAFGAAGWELLGKTLEAIPKDIPILIDAKRGDIDSTAQAYADAIFGGLGADAVTLNPYMGADSARPFLAWPGKGVFMLCKTSNPGARVFQEIDIGGEPLYISVARECTSWSDSVGLVVAGNDCDALARVRAASPRTWFLAPGIGAQGGAADAAVEAGARVDGLGLLVVAARAIANAPDPGQAARVLRDTMLLAQQKVASGADRVVPGWGDTGRGRGTGAGGPSMPAAPRPAAADQPAPKACPPAAEPAPEGVAALKRQLIGALVDTACFRLGDFVLKSGKHSPFYIDLRRLISNPDAMETAARAYASMAGSLNFDRVAGIPAAGLPLATAACLAMQVPMIWPRMPVKEHGTGNRIEGAYGKGECILLLDDLITTGESKKEAVTILRDEGLIVEDLIVLIERGRQGRPDMESIGIGLHAFLHVAELFGYCEELGMIDSREKTALQRFVDEE